MKDKFYENWKKFLENLKKIRVKLAWRTYVFEGGFWGTSSRCWEILFSISPCPPPSKKKRSPKSLWNFFTISSKSLRVFSTIFSKFSKILRYYSKVSSLVQQCFPKIRAVFLLIYSNVFLPFYQKFLKWSLLYFYAGYTLCMIHTNLKFVHHSHK